MFTHVGVVLSVVCQVNLLQSVCSVQEFESEYLHIGSVAFDCNGKYEIVFAVGSRFQKSVVIGLLCTSINMGSNVTPNTLAYWNFDDQNASQITDATGNGRNLTGSIPTYALLSGTDYYGIFNGTKGGGINWGVSDNFTIVLYMQITNISGHQYIFKFQGTIRQFAIICGYDSQKLELYNESTRFTIQNSTPINTRMMIGITKSGSTIKAYYNGQLVNQTNSGALSGVSNTNLGNSGTTDFFKGYINNVILEQGIRSDADFLNYWNKTKSKYGLS